MPNFRLGSKGGNRVKSRMAGRQGKIAHTLRPVIENAVLSAMQALTVSLAKESEYVINEFQWNWTGPAEPRERSITDTGELVESIEIDMPRKTSAGYVASLGWNPTDGDYQYAGLVHDGAKDFFEYEGDDGPEYYDYTPRPFTAMLMPASQRGQINLNAHSPISIASLPQHPWKWSWGIFEQELYRKLSYRFTVVRL